MNSNTGSRTEVSRSKLEAILLQVSRVGAVSMDADLVCDLGIDSLSMMSLIMEVEETFGVVIGGKEIEANVLKTPSSLLEFILSQ